MFFSRLARGPLLGTRSFYRWGVLPVGGFRLRSDWRWVPDISNGVDVDAATNSAVKVIDKCYLLRHRTLQFISGSTLYPDTVCAEWQSSRQAIDTNNLAACSHYLLYLHALIARFIAASSSLTRVIRVSTSGSVYCTLHVSRQPAAADAGADDVMTKLSEQSPLMISLRQRRPLHVKKYMAPITNTICIPSWNVKITRYVYAPVDSDLDLWPCDSCHCFALYDIDMMQWRHQILYLWSPSTRHYLVRQCVFGMRSKIDVASTATSRRSDRLKSYGCDL